ncbi:LysR family transcriptional regulator [Pseudoalteromonas sp. SR44-5]|uniref:LysR family transcriptional regulator n=1 Tax=Pseudoalteromonas rhizosphaerae TaxID=2518973 RepID=A0ABW8KX42_9GAMM|nr:MULTISPECIES: LysR family transcriptional regulator [unclassified Pseudoalteromonas]MBB1365288.1 LysR family transcriptional regulator [Pseudoalteromonas sp. SR44-5]MBB1416846.1 LysR family transcriptional regulator [Pseudoalteromonas sp. SG44-1]
MRHLKAFHVFHITAESSSYSEAADKLHITHGAVSKQVKLLETHLSQCLFYKEGRNMRLTSKGKLLKQYTNKAFEALDTGVKKLTIAADNYLEVSCEPTLTMRWLMPRISNFYKISDIDIRLSTAGGPIFLGESGLSMAIRRDDFDVPTHHVKNKLVEEWVGPVMSFQYWERFKNNLANITLLHSKTRIHAWKSWLSASNFNIQLNNNNQSFDHFYFCLQAAADGLGVAIGSFPLVADDLNHGRLIAPFGFIKSGHNYVLLQQSQKQGVKEEQFQKWLEVELSKCIPDEDGMKPCFLPASI